MHPILFVMGGAPVYSYGVMLAVGLLAAVTLLAFLAGRDKLPVGGVVVAAVAAAIGGVYGSRLLYMIVSADDLVQFADFRRGGLTSYGGLLGALAAGGIVLRLWKIPALPVADIAAPGFALVLYCTRVGCYLFGCDFGIPLSAGAPRLLQRLGTFPHWPAGTLPLGEGSPAWVQHVQVRGLSPTAAASLPVHPTQLYEVIVGAILLWLFFFLRRRQTFRGQIFFALVLAYGACRFGLEILRDEPERGQVGPALPAHLLVAAGFALFAIGFARWVAPTIEAARARRVAKALAFVPGILAFALLWPASFAEVTLVTLSSAQVMALLTGLAAAFAFSRLHAAALADPQAAMEIAGVARSDAHARPKKKRRRKKRPDDASEGP